MKRFLIATALVVLSVTVIVGAVLLIAPAGPVTSWLTHKIEDSTGRTMSVQGATSLKLVPRVMWRAENVVVSNPPGMAGDPLLRAGAIEVHGQLPALVWSYIAGGSAALDLIKVDEPKLALAVDKEGRKSWELAAPASRPGTSRALPAVGEISITGGSATYRDERAGTGIELAQIRAVGKQTQVAAPIATEFEFVWKGDKITGTGSVGPLEGRAQGSPTPINLTLAARHGKLGIDGDLIRGDSPKLAGKANGTTPSLRALLAWLGVDAPGSTGLGAATVDGDVQWHAGNQIVLITNGRVSLDATKAQGAGTIDYGSTPPHVVANVTADRLDVSRYVPDLTPARTRTTRVRTASVAVVAAEPDKALITQSLKAYLDALDSGAATGAVTRERAAPALPTVGSDDPINLGWLKKVDLNLDVGIGTVTVGDIELGLPKLVAVLRQGELSADARDVVTRGGRVSLKTVVDTRPSVPTHRTSVTAGELDALDILEDVGVRELLAGKGSLEAELSGAVASTRQLVSTLSGRLKARVNQGAIVGYDFRRMYLWWLSRPSYDPDVRTAFSRLDADVTLDKGVARSSAVQLQGPVIGGDADGTAQLANRQLDARARLTNHPLAWLGTFFGHICCAWDSLKIELGRDASTRSPAGESTAAAPEGVDLDDPELAPLMKRVLANAEARGTLGPAATETLERLLQRAEEKRQ